jgi:alpha-galactosidase
MVEDPKLFPNGLKSVVDYVHSKGLKFGIYSARGSITCMGRPGSDGHEAQDAALWASWGLVSPAHQTTPPPPLEKIPKPKPYKPY